MTKDRHYGQHTGAPIPRNMPVSMSLCEELHLVGGGCKYDNICCPDEIGCILEKEKDT